MWVDVRKRESNSHNPKHRSPMLYSGGVGAIRPLPKDGGVEELHEDSTLGPYPKVWSRGQK